MKNNLKLWHRIGDGSEYHHVGQDLDALIDVLRDAYLGGNICQTNGGICSDNYSGWNYVSIYWGDDEANLERQLSEKEFQTIYDALEEDNE